MFYSEIHSEMGRGPRETRKRLGERMRDAADLAIAFLLLEDDYAVDWELPEEFERAAVADRALRERALRRTTVAGAVRGRERRPGAIPVKPQPCLSPVRRRVTADLRHQARGR